MTDEPLTRSPRRETAVPAGVAPAGAPGEAISFHDVHKRYGPTVALAGVSFDVNHGEKVALLGPNGAGKSTAVGVMLGLLKPDAGTAGILGTAPDRAVSAGRVGAMLQSSGLPADASVAEVLDLARQLYPRPLPFDELVALAGLEGVVGRRADKLSGGESQRVRFALSMAGDPELVFLDEPTVSMDVEARRSFWASMERLAARGCTVVFCTHYLEEADAVADRIVVLNAGRVVADGTAAAIKASAGARIVRFELDDADPVALTRLPGVAHVDVEGVRVVLRSSDSDATVRELFRQDVPLRHLEVTGAGLEEAFLALTHSASAIPPR